MGDPALRPPDHLIRPYYGPGCCNAQLPYSNSVWYWGDLVSAFVIVPLSLLCPICFIIFLVTFVFLHPLSYYEQFMSKFGPLLSLHLCTVLFIVVPLFSLLFLFVPCCSLLFHFVPFCSFLFPFSHCVSFPFYYYNRVLEVVTLVKLQLCGEIVMWWGNQVQALLSVDMIVFDVFDCILWYLVVVSLVKVCLSLLGVFHV